MSISQQLVVAKESNEVWADESRKDNLLQEIPRSRAMMFRTRFFKSPQSRCNMEDVRFRAHTHVYKYRDVYKIRGLNGSIVIRRLACYFATLLKRLLLRWLISSSHGSSRQYTSFALSLAPDIDRTSLENGVYAL